ncbi:MAG: hypothetical protein LBQ15_05015 [Clostridium sp.]|nr:hypothetical protein [Clostridium sp.]
MTIKEKPGKYRLLLAGISQAAAPAKDGAEQTPAKSGPEYKESKRRTQRSFRRGFFGAAWRKGFRKRRGQRSPGRLGQEALCLQIRLLQERILPYAQEAGSCYTVYDEPLKVWLRTEGRLEVWRNHWPYGAFDAGRELLFAEELLNECHSPHLLILGYAPCVPELVYGRARRMKSLRFLLDCQPRGLADFLEELYEEYGLAASFQMFPVNDGEQERPFRLVQVSCQAPTVVLDFTGEPRVPVGEVAKGSMWIDVDDMEEKRRRIESYGGITYVSFRKIWKAVAEQGQPDSFSHPC